MDFLEDSTFERDLSPVARLLAAHDLPSPSEIFLQTVSSEVNRQDVSKMKEAQEHMLQRFEKTNEMLLNFNSLSSGRYEATAKEFKHHTQLLADMKKDLNNVFRRIRTLKSQLSKQHPDAFRAYDMVPPVTEEDEEDEESMSCETTPTRQVPSSREQAGPSFAADIDNEATPPSERVTDRTVPQIVEPNIHGPKT